MEWVIIIGIILLVYWALTGGIKPRGGPCFYAGTMVLTPTGPRPIEEIKTGDSIMCCDPFSKKFTVGQVTKVMNNPDDQRPTKAVRVTFEDGGTLIPTALENLLNQNEWRRTGTLKCGDVIAEQRVIEAQEMIIPSCDAFDFFVAPHPNYVVLTTTNVPIVGHDHSSIKWWGIRPERVPRKAA